MPAPPARIRSANVPCGTSSTSSSPDRKCRSNSLFSPTYVAIILRTCRDRSSTPMPKSSTPALLLITVRPRVPRARSAAIRVSGMPHSPKPPIIIVAPSGMRATASSAPDSTLFTGGILSSVRWLSHLMHPDLEQAIGFHESIVAEGGKALVGYDTAKALANVVLMSEIPTSYDKKEQRQVNAGNLLLRGVPGVGKTFFGVILAAISNAKFARLQGRADLQPTEVVGFQMINPSAGALVTEFGPMASAEVILLDEINRIPMKSQSAFLEALQDRTVTVGKETYELPAFSFAIATMNPVELGQGTFPLSEAATDRFAIMINIGYLPPEEEEKLVNFDFKRVRLGTLMAKERIVELRARINEQVFLHERLGKYIQRLVAATRPYNPDTDWYVRSPSELVERGVDLGASPRAIICWGRLAQGRRRLPPRA